MSGAASPNASPALAARRDDEYPAALRVGLEHLGRLLKPFEIDDLRAIVAAAVAAR